MHYRPSICVQVVQLPIDDVNNIWKPVHLNTLNIEQYRQHIDGHADAESTDVQPLKWSSRFLKKQLKNDMNKTYLRNQSNK